MAPVVCWIHQPQRGHAGRRLGRSRILSIPDFGPEERAIRSHDNILSGDAITFREALRLFATKEEMAAVRLAVEETNRKIGQFVTRGEHELRWRRDDEFRVDTKADLKTLMSSRLPTWFFSAIAAGAAVASIFWRH